MAASREWTEWHLTPSGWKRGSEKTDFAPVKKVSPPNDRVLTCLFKEVISSSFGGVDRGTSEVWKSGNAEEIKELINNYGDCPNRL